MFNETIDIIKQIFGNDIFKVYDKSKQELMNKFSGPLFDSIAIACSMFDNHTLMKHADEIRKQVNEIKMNNLEYYDCCYGGSGSKDKVVGRITIIYNVISNITGKYSNQQDRRLFTSEEKLKLWNSENNHICSYCNQTILSIEDAEVDHVLAYSNGFDTDLKNAQLLHRHCNREKYNNDDSDFNDDYNNIENNIVEDE